MILYGSSLKPPRTVHGEGTADQRFAGLEVTAEERDGLDVHDDTADVGRQFSGRYLSAGRRIDEDFFCALRVGGRETDELCHVFELFVLFHGLQQHFECVCLVVLDPDVGILEAEPFDDFPDAGQDVLRMIEHFTVVDRDVGLTFRSIDDEGVDACVLFERKFDMGREACAAETDEPGRTNCVQEVLFRLDDRGLHFFGERHFSVGFDDNGVDHVAVDDPDRFDRFDRTGNGGMDRCTDKCIGAADDLTDFDFIAHFYLCFVGSTDML